MAGPDKLAGLDVIGVEAAARRWYDPHTAHCLPLVQAGQLGWTVLSPLAIDAVWDGSEGRTGVRFRKGLPREAPGVRVRSLFGKAIVSVALSLYVRTSPGVDLLVKAPPNAPKDGVWPLEGLVDGRWQVLDA